MTAGKQIPDSLHQLLPLEVQGWKPAGPDGLYSGDTLFDLIDGGAEVYRALNVQNVISRRYGRSGAPDIIVDVFDMGSSEDAFGAYHHDVNEGQTAGVGQESEYLGGNLSFWQSRFFVSVTALGETEETRRAVRGLAAAVSKRIQRRGSRPYLVQLLPERGLVKSQIHYFHDKQLLDRYYSFSAENVLDLDRSTDGVIAHYRFSKHQQKQTVLLLICYPSPKRAARAHGRFRAEYMQETARGSAETSQEYGPIGARALEEIVVIVFDGVTERETRDLIEGVASLKGS